ncbi:MAG: type I CRISPR-associated protein Cas7 [Akkermansia sp.]
MNVNYPFPAKGNAYILFGFEAIQARPNLDPYTSTLRTNDETGQVFTSDVHIKHHVRRGLKAYAEEINLPHSDQSVFYEKEDDQGNARTFASRLESLREACEITKQDKKDALLHTLDLPMFGYVHASKGENFNVAGAINTLFRPVTFHACDIYSLGRNNAFPGEGKDSAGSATVDSLEYGFFLSLWEVNLNMLRINAEKSEMINWQQQGATGWIESLVNGMWKAYSSDRYPSFTQRSQFAQFVLGWLPEGNVSFANPADLYEKLDDTQIKTHTEAMSALQQILPDFLSGWGMNEKNIFISHRANNFTVNLPDQVK